MHVGDGDNEGIISTLQNAELTAFNKISVALESEGYRLDVWSLLRLLSSDCPLITGRSLGGERVTRQTKRATIRRQMTERASKAIVDMEAIEIPKNIDFSSIAKGSAQDKDLSGSNDGDTRPDGRRPCDQLS